MSLKLRSHDRDAFQDTCRDKCTKTLTKAAGSIAGCLVLLLPETSPSLSETLSSIQDVVLLFSSGYFYTFQDVGILIPGRCSSPIETLFLFASRPYRMESVAWSWMGEYSRSSGKASETRYCRKRLGRIAMRHGSGRLSLLTGSLLRCEVRLCLVSHYARCCLTYPKPLASQTPGQGFVVAITIWPERSRFSLLREYPSKPSAVASTSSRTTLLE
jgi:hypothetical protein